MNAASQTLLTYKPLKSLHGLTCGKSYVFHLILFSLRTTKELALALYRMLESLCYIRKTHLSSKNTVEYW